jgi:hypothetical protein
MEIEALESAISGCPDPTAGRAVVIPAGGSSSVIHQLRDSSGVPVDLSGFIDAPALIKAYVANALCHDSKIEHVNATIEDAEIGKIKFNLPASIGMNPGIYEAEVWAAEDSANFQGSVKFQNTFLISIERSLLARSAGSIAVGPITIGEVRMQLRDFPQLNEYWNNNEFSTAEIVHSLIQPIYVWNETPPPVIKYSASSFPYRSKWLDATTANLMRTAAAWLLRNHRTIRYADGTVDSDKDKYREYLQIAENKWAEYKVFCATEKLAINMRTPPSIAGYYS